MALKDKVQQTTRKNLPPKLVVGGESGIGKTLFISQMPNVIALLTEDGAHHVDMPAFPLVRSFDEVMEAIGDLYREEHSYEWLAIDSADWLEPIIAKQAAANNGWDSVDAAPYGRGYTEAAKLWRRVLTGLDALRNERGMGVCFTSHGQVKRIETPTTDGYDAFTLKLHHKVASQLTEWADIIGWACYRVATKREDQGFGKERKRAIGTGERLLLVEPNPAYPSKTRYGITDGPLDWATFSNALNALNTEK